MKYYTPELIALVRSQGDLDEVESRWQEAGERYAGYLEQVRDSFPRGLRRIFQRYYLHDALVQRIFQKDTAFLIQLRLDPPPHSVLTFRYRLLRPAVIDKDALPEEYRAKGPYIEWTYSEVEQLTTEDVLASRHSSSWVKDEWLEEANSATRKTGSKWPFWCHRILLSNGWELNLAFHDVKVEEYEDLLLSAATASSGPRHESRSPGVR